MKRLFLLAVVVLAFPIYTQAHCALNEFLVEPSPAWYGEEIEAVFRGSCSDGAGPSAPHVSVEGSSIILTFSDAQGGPLAPSRWGERVVLGKLLPGTYQVVMRTAMQGEWGRRTLEVRPRPFSVVPMTGHAGMRVVLRGVHSIDCSVTGPCTPVLFGGVPATDVQSNEGGDLSVRVPAHAPGTVDVTITTGGAPVTLRDGFRYGDPGEADFDVVLFPSTLYGTGLHGSQWQSDIIVKNESPAEMSTEPQFWVSDAPVIPIPQPFPPEGKAYFPWSQTDGGAFLYLPRGADSYFSFASHIVDKSRSTTDRGTEVPVVRRRDTAADLWLPNVPIDPLFRARLRVYDFDARDDRSVVVTAVAEDGSTHQFGMTLRAQRIVCPTTPCLQPRPGFAAVDLSVFESLRNRPVVDIRIHSHQRDARLWAFVTVTNNETQRVTMHTPQHDRPLR